MLAFRYACAVALTALIALAIPAFASPKKGIGISTNDPHWAMELRESNVAWYYNWGQDKPANIPPGIEFVPMAWNGDVAEHLNLPHGTKVLLGFNEPDRPDQANMTVDQALADWPLLEKADVALGSPAPSWWSADWMKQFMQTAAQQNLRVDFVCIHWYNVPDPQFFLNTIQQIYATYHKPSGSRSSPWAFSGPTSRPTRPLRLAPSCKR